MGFYDKILLNEQGGEILNLLRSNRTINETRMSRKILFKNSIGLSFKNL